MEASTKSEVQSVPGPRRVLRAGTTEMQAPVSEGPEARRLKVVPGTPPSPAPVSEREAVVVGTDLALLAPLVSGLRSKGIHALLTMSPG